ncbi:MAG: LysM peptidoglycan-binding domain-containing protein, partial [Verrucomicrobiales bacterium]|nr:LysM peptidoglycan-binding domain-containing protein [Verrucomicrobiales bacterium]
DAMRRENLALRAQVTNWVAVGTAWSNEVRRLTQELTLANAASAAAATSVPTRSGTVSPGQGSAPRGTTSGVGTPAPTPRTATAAGRAFTPTPGTRFYRIAVGDTLASIARRHGISVGALRSANPTLNDRRLLPGTIVRIPVR